jgi:sporulation protein YlmC with PRC-barrel domain
MQRDDDWLQAADYLRRRSVVGTDGRRLGRVDDILLDEQGRFVGYQLAEVAVQGPLAQSRFIPATATQSIGKDVLLVDSSRLDGDSIQQDEMAHTASPQPTEMQPQDTPRDWSAEPRAGEPGALQVPLRQTGRETIELGQPDEPPPDPDETL